MLAGLDGGADMALGAALADAYAIEADAPDQDGIVAHHRLWGPAAQKPSANAHRMGIEIADVKHFLAETIEQLEGAAIGARWPQLQGGVRFVDIVQYMESDVLG